MFLSAGPPARISSRDAAAQRLYRLCGGKKAKVVLAFALARPAVLCCILMNIFSYGVK